MASDWTLVRWTQPRYFQSAVEYLQDLETAGKSPPSSTMVLTRAQHAAQEAASLDAVEDMETAIVEHVDQAPSAIEKAPSVGDQLASLAQHLLLRTQALAAEHTVLQHQQQGQSDAQYAALMAVQALTETSVKNLTDQQRIIVEKLGEALTATHAGLHEQFQRMQMVQDERGGQIERFMNDRLAQALQAVQRETRVPVSKFCSSRKGSSQAGGGSDQS